MAAPLSAEEIAALSTLERQIERFQTQRTCLARAAALVAAVPGPVVELGLGKGRTFDHLRRLLPGREIHAFDRALHAVAGCIPAPDHLVLGELTETLPGAAERLGGRAALVHADLGTSDAEADARTFATLAPLVEALVGDGGVVAADRPVPAPRLAPLALPPDARWPYFLYRLPPAAGG